MQAKAPVIIGLKAIVALMRAKRRLWSRQMIAVLSLDTSVPVCKIFGGSEICQLLTPEKHVAEAVHAPALHELAVGRAQAPREVAMCNGHHQATTGVCHNCLRHPARPRQSETLMFQTMALHFPLNPSKFYLPRSHPHRQLAGVKVWRLIDRSPSARCASALLL